MSAPDRGKAGRRLALLATLAFAPAAHPAPGKTADPVIARDGTTQLTASQLRAIVAGLPPETRATVGADQAALADLARNTLLQNALLAQAHAQSWDRQPAVLAEIERSRQAIIVRSFVSSQLPAAPPPTEAQIAAAYAANKTRFMVPRQFHLAQIFLAVPPDAAAATVDAARARLVALRPQLTTQTAFADDAKQFSDDKRSASAGGDLGWLREDALVDPIKSAVAGLPEASVSDPLRTPDGWHLIRLIATSPAGPAPLDQVRPTLVAALVEQQRQSATRAYVDAELRRTPIEIDAQQLAQAAKSP